MSEVYFNGGQSQASRVIRALMGTLTGHLHTYPELARGVFLTIGFAALSDIQADFVRKSRGQVGEDGNKWPPLSPEYLAYNRRFGPGEKARLKKAAGLTARHHYAPGDKDGLLSKSELKRWRQIYGHTLTRLALSMPIPAAKARAAQIAWVQLKAAGAQTKLSVYGSRQVDILRDTGLLLNSLSPGRFVAAEGDVLYFPPGVAEGNQIMEPDTNGITVGTKVAYARAHNEGYKGIPERRFIPKQGQIPAVWLNRWLDAGMQAVAVAIRIALAHGAR